MNLKESIKKILKEERKPSSYLIRRVTADRINDEFKGSLDYVSYKLKGNYGLKKFQDRVMTVMMDGLHGELSNWGRDDFPYEEIEEFLLDTYSDEMVERYHQMYGDEHLRNLQEETINEDFKEDLIKVIDRDGLETASKLVSGYDNYLGTSSSGTIYGWTVGTSGTTYITGTLVVTGGSANISVCAAPAGTSETVVANCSLTGAGTYNFSATANTAGAPVCDDLIVGPGTYTVNLSGTFGTNSVNQSVYIN